MRLGMRGPNKTGWSIDEIDVEDITFEGGCLVCVKLKDGLEQLIHISSGVLTFRPSAPKKTKRQPPRRSKTQKKGALDK